VIAPAPDVLFAPFSLKSMRLKNRIVMAPMTRSFALGGLPNVTHVDYYRRRAAGQVDVRPRNDEAGLDLVEPDGHPQDPLVDCSVLRTGVAEMDLQRRNTPARQRSRSMSQPMATTAS
jgi:hypothetical protein